jgi:hypothetical protein
MSYILVDKCCCIDNDLLPNSFTISMLKSRAKCRCRQMIAILIELYQSVHIDKYFDAFLTYIIDIVPEKTLSYV